MHGVSFLPSACLTDYQKENRSSQRFAKLVLGSLAEGKGGLRSPSVELLTEQFLVSPGAVFHPVLCAVVGGEANHGGKVESICKACEEKTCEKLIDDPIHRLTTCV